MILAPAAVRGVGDATPTDHDLAILRFDVLAAMWRLDAEVATGGFQQRQWWSVARHSPTGSTWARSPGYFDAGGSGHAHERAPPSRLVGRLQRRES